MQSLFCTICEVSQRAGEQESASSIQGIHHNHRDVHTLFGGIKADIEAALPLCESNTMCYLSMRSPTA